MSLQAKMAQPHDPRLYSPNRDTAHNFDYVIQEVASRVEARAWDALTEYAKASDVSDLDLGLGCQCLCRYVMGSVDDPKESMSQSLTRSGFLDLKPAVRVILMAYLGTVTLGIHWVGVREATLDGTGPVLSYVNLRSVGRRQVALMRMSRRARWWHRLRLRLRRSWRAFCREA